MKRQAKITQTPGWFTAYSPVSGGYISKDFRDEDDAQQWIDKLEKRKQARILK